MFLLFDRARAFAWYQYGEFHSNYGDKEKALRGYRNAADIKSDNVNYLVSLGHYAAEVFLDIDLSFSSLRQAYEVDPKNDLVALNYIEALITKSRYDEAYELSERVLERTQLLRFFICARFFSMCSRCLGDISEKKKRSEIRSFLGIMQETSYVELGWGFQNLRHHVNGAGISKKTKSLLGAVMDCMERKSSIEELTKLANYQ